MGLPAWLLYLTAAATAQNLIHYAGPGRSGTVQESGRAARDGMAAHSVVYYSDEDAGLARFLIKKATSSYKYASPVSIARC